MAAVGVSVGECAEACWRRGGTVQGRLQMQGKFDGMQLSPYLYATSSRCNNAAALPLCPSSPSARVSMAHCASVRPGIICRCLSNQYTYCSDGYSRPALPRAFVGQRRSSQKTAAAVPRQGKVAAPARQRPPYLTYISPPHSPSRQSPSHRIDENSRTCRSLCPELPTPACSSQATRSRLPLQTHMLQNVY